MKAKNKVSRLLSPFVVIALGALYIITRKGSSGYGEPAVESPWVAVVGVFCCLLGAWAFVRGLREIRSEEKEPDAKTRESYLAAADLIDAFIDNRVAEWDWDDFTSVKKNEAFLESVRQHCLSVYEIYPSHERQHYCSPEGIAVLRGVAKELRERAA